MSRRQRGLLWIAGGVLGVVGSQLLLAIGSLLGILLFPVGVLCAVYGIYLTISTTRSSETWSQPLDWSIAAAALLGAGVLAWINQDWMILLSSVIVVSLVVTARQRRARLAREWQDHVALHQPGADSDEPPQS